MDFEQIPKLLALQNAIADIHAVTTDLRRILFYEWTDKRREDEATWLESTFSLPVVKWFISIAWNVMLYSNSPRRLKIDVIESKKIINLLNASDLATQAGEECDALLVKYQAKEIDPNFTQRRILQIAKCLQELNDSNMIQTILDSISDGNERPPGEKPKGLT